MSDAREVAEMTAALQPVMKSWGVMSRHGEWSDEEAQYDAARAAAKALLPLLAQVKATARAEGAREALEEAADAWQRGEWTVITATTRLPRPEATLGTAQAVTDWLRDRARSLSAPTEDAP